MAVIKERIILRKGRRSGEKMPHRINIKDLTEGDSLFVEITIDKANDLVSVSYTHLDVYKRQSLCRTGSGCPM